VPVRASAAPARSARQATAGGRASSGGTRFHASSAVAVYASILAKTPLLWFGLAGRVPTAVSAESGGGGDDLQIEFAVAVSEAQVRHQMNAAGKFTALIDDIVTRTHGRSPTPIALVAGRHDSSAKLFTDVRRDLEGLRAQVEEARLTEPVRGLLADPEKRRVLENLYIVDADFEVAASPDRENVLEKLRRRLVDEERADEAWSVLFEDAVDLCAKGSRRDFDDLVTVLKVKGIEVRPSTADEELRAQLESIRTRILEEHYSQLAESELRRVIAEIDARSAGPETRSEAMRLLAHSLLAQERLPEACDAAQRGVELSTASPDTHYTYSRVLLAVGNVPRARDEADRALAADPESRRAWIAHLHVCLKTGSDPGKHPARLLADPAFRISLAEIRGEQGRYTEVIELTEPLVRNPSPSPVARYYHATAITQLAMSTDPPNLADLRSSESELSILIDTLRLDHPLLKPVTFQRAQVRRFLGENEKADHDEEQLRRLNRDDPQIVEQLAVAHAGRGDIAGALAILETSVVPASSSLLALRAELLAGVGRLDEARRDLDAADAVMAASDDPDRTAMQLGEVAAVLGDFARARTFHGRMSAAAQSGPQGYRLLGQIAFLEGKIDDAEVSMRGAIAAEPNAQQAVLLRLQLAGGLLHAGRSGEAHAVLDGVGLDEIPEVGLRLYILSAFSAGDLVAAMHGLDRLSQAGPLPTWALSIRADIGLRSDDPTAVAADLTSLLATGESSARVHLTLARVLIETGDTKRAATEVDAALAVDVTPRERLEASLYLQHLRRVEEAVGQAFLAYREDRNDPQIQRTLAALVLTGGADLAAPATVGVGSHVRLVRTGAKPREHSIFADRPIEKAAGELTLEEARDMLGKAVGDQVTRERTPLPDEVWTIEEIVPAEVHAARTIYTTFHENFPNEPFFVEAVHVGNLDKPEDFTELLTMLGSRHDRVTKALEIYHQQGLPLEFVANTIGTTIPELMDLGRNPAAGPLLIEWPGASDYVAAIDLGKTANVLVLTRSALLTARREGLLIVLETTFELVAPRSLERQLRDELAQAEEAVAKGRSTIMSAPPGWQTVDVPPSEPGLVAIRDDAAETLDWVLKNVALLPRPLDALGASTEEDDQLDRDAVRERLGPASFDASILVVSNRGILYADDLGLRRYAVRGSGPIPGVSTATLVEALASRGVLPSDERARIHADLVLAGYAFIPPSAALLADAIARMPGLGKAGFQTIFATLGSPLSDVGVAAVVTADALRAAATQVIDRVTLEEVTEAIIEGLSARWPRVASVELVRAVASRELHLLPNHLERVLKVCDRLGAQDIPTL